MSLDFWSAIRPYTADGETLNIVIETPMGCRSKFKYLTDSGLFELHGMLPAGMIFPFNFGFIPQTMAEDGDPSDVLVLMDEPAFVGCLVRARLIGVIEAEQTEKGGEKVRNDRLVAVASECRDHSDLKSLKDMNIHFREEIEHFFMSYNEIKGKQFKVLDRHGPGPAHKLVDAAINHCHEQQRCET